MYPSLSFFHDHILLHHSTCQNQDCGIDLMLLGTDFIWMPLVITGSLLTLFTLRKFIVAWHFIPCVDPSNHHHNQVTDWLIGTERWPGVNHSLHPLLKASLCLINTQNLDRKNSSICAFFLNLSFSLLKSINLLYILFLDL